MARILVIGDTHCPGMHVKYPSFLQQTYRKYECDRVIHIGDLVDNAAISFHDKNPSLSSAADEHQKALKQVAKLYRMFLRVDWLIGNHDALTERQAFKIGLPDYSLRDYTDIWNVPEWKCHPRYTRLKVDNVVYTHGDCGKGGMYSAVKNARDNFISWVSGHHHSEAGVWWTTVEGSRVFGMNVGCGVDNDLLQFEYGKIYNRKPTLGCGVVLNGRQAIFEPM